MKAIIILTLLTIFSISGCADFIAPGDKEESRASRPSPADINTKRSFDKSVIIRDTAKAAPIIPAEEK